MKLLLVVLFLLTSQGERIYEKCCMEGCAYDVNGKCVEVPEENTPWTNYTVVFTDKLVCKPGNNKTNNTSIVTMAYQLPDFYFVDGGIFIPKVTIHPVEYEDFCLEFFADDDGFVLGMVGCFEPADAEISANFLGKLLLFLHY